MVVVVGVGATQGNIGSFMDETWPSPEGFIIEDYMSSSSKPSE